MADTPHPLDPHLAAYLAERDEPCPACNYNLRGLKTDRCPECNRELILQIRLAEPRLAAWITSLVATCSMLGFNGLLSLYFLVMVNSRGRGPRDRPIAYALFISTGIAAIVLMFLLWRRRWFCNLSANGRVAIAIGTCILTAASTMAFFALAH